MGDGAQQVCRHRLVQGRVISHVEGGVQAAQLFDTPGELGVRGDRGGDAILMRAFELSVDVSLQIPVGDVAELSAHLIRLRAMPLPPSISSRRRSRPRDRRDITVPTGMASARAASL